MIQFFASYHGRWSAQGCGECHDARPEIAIFRVVANVIVIIWIWSGTSTANADQLKFQGSVSWGYSPIYNTPREGAQWEADQVGSPHHIDVQNVCGIDYSTTRVWFNATADYWQGIQCALPVRVFCQSPDGTFSVPNAPNGNSFSCACPTGQYWDAVSNVCTDGYYISANQSSQSDLGSQCCVGKPRLGDPIDPSNGNVSKLEGDLASGSSSNSMVFRRFHNSGDMTAGNGVAWRHSFSRTIQPINNSVPYPNGQVSSPLYSDPASACTSGFAQIQSQVGNWQGATASYSNGVCLLAKAGATIAAIPVLTSSTQLAVPLNVITGFDAIRDDGQLIRFTMQGSTLSAPPTVDFKLRQTDNGFVLKDRQDNVETYDANGRILSIASRAGVIQTMNYDGSGRLSAVTDHFGHSISLSYDAQDRVYSVTRQ